VNIVTPQAMPNDGKRLESLVAFVEKTLLPFGFEVKTNERVFNYDGIQIAEFDVEARGRVGTTNFAWLIECRDRPAGGPAPSSWIEQLVGRRERFRFNKVTAVSTTGFATGATDFAASQDIELREVRSLNVDEFSDWLGLRYLTNHVRHTTLQGITALLHEGTSEELRSALEAMLLTANGRSPILRSSKTGELVTPDLAFSGAVGSNSDLFSDLTPNGDAKQVQLHATYPDDDHFIVDTPIGSVPLPGIVYMGSLRLKENILPLTYTAEYRNSTTGEPISQVVSFAPTSAMDMKFAIEMHRFEETGQTHVTLRRLPDGA